MTDTRVANGPPNYATDAPRPSCAPLRSPPASAAAGPAPSQWSPNRSAPRTSSTASRCSAPARPSLSTSTTATSPCLSCADQRWPHRQADLPGWRRRRVVHPRRDPALLPERLRQRGTAHLLDICLHRRRPHHRGHRHHHPHRRRTRHQHCLGALCVVARSGSP